MKNNGVDKVIEVFREKDDFLITAHVNPEGDSIGSQLAVRNILKKLGKKACIVDHDVVPDNLMFLPGAELVMKSLPADLAPGAAVVLDCPVKERVGRVSGGLERAPLVVNIDHHVSNEYFGDVNWVEPQASSVGEMLFRLAEKAEVEIDKDLAVIIYTAIVTDTGMFNYSNTSRETHRVAGELIRLGVDPKAVHGEIFEKRSLPEVRLLGRALTTLKVESGGKLAYMFLTRKMYGEEGVDSVSTDEFINYPRSIKGVEAALFFKEAGDPEGSVNVSFRSQGRINVNEVAATFGGGGHKQAAGCLLKGGIEEASKNVLAEVKKALEDAC